MQDFLEAKVKEMVIGLKYPICEPCPEILRRTECKSTCTEKKQLLIDSPVDFDLPVGLLASVLISPGDGMNPWWWTGCRNGFHE